MILGVVTTPPVRDWSDQAHTSWRSQLHSRNYPRHDQPHASNILPLTSSYRCDPKVQPNLAFASSGRGLEVNSARLLSICWFSRNVLLGAKRWHQVSFYLSFCLHLKALSFDGSDEVIDDFLTALRTWTSPQAWPALPHLARVSRLRR